MIISQFVVLQELLALSTALSATLTAQLAFDSKHLKYCSTYNLAEAVDKNMKKGIYHLGDAYELAVTPRKTNWYSRGLIGKCLQSTYIRVDSKMTK